MSYSALVVGLGQIGMGYDLEQTSDSIIYSHARSLNESKSFNLVGGVDLDKSSRDIFERAYGANVYESLEKAFENQTYDIVIVATPTTTHYKVICKLLELGKPKVILCEKPLSYDLDEARKITSLCFNNQIGLYVNYMRRSEPGVIDVKHRLETNQIIGPVKGVTWYSKGFLHNCSHFFNLLEYWLGEMQGFKIINGGKNLVNGDAEPDVRVAFEKGEITFLTASAENFSHNTIEIIASNGRLRYENAGQKIEWAPAIVDKSLRNYNFLAMSPEIIFSDFGRYQLHVVEQLSNMLDGKTANLCNGIEALKTLEQMHRILEGRE